MTGRTFAKLLCSTWTDDDFLELSDPAMVLYWALVGQPDISPAGIVALTERRWRRYLDGGLDAVHTALDELTARRYIILDEDTAEVWVRSFIRHDGRLDNSKLAKSVHRAVGDIRSAQLRDACRREYPHVGPDMADRRPIQGRSEADHLRRNSTRPPEPVDNPETPGGRAIEGPSKADRCTEARSQEPEPRPAASSREPHHALPDEFLGAVIDSIIGLRLQRERNIHNPQGWRRKLERELPTEHGPRITELRRQFPTAAATSIAAAIHSGDTRPLAPHARQETP